MKKLLYDFFDRYFHDEESLILLILLAVGLILLVLIGEILAPLIAAIVIAYLMQGLMNLLLRYGASARLAFFFLYAVYQPLRSDVAVPLAKSMGPIEAAGERNTQASA